MADENIKTEEKKHEKPEDKKPAAAIAKKSEAVSRGLNLHASLKHCMFISRFIKRKSIDNALDDLNKVLKFKFPIPFKGEIPHRKGAMMSGRYPISAIKEIIPVLKSLKGNVIANKMELEKTKIYYASPSWASLPSKRRGGKFKRVNILIKAKEFQEAGK